MAWEYELQEDKNFKNHWRVEGHDYADDGQYSVAIFSGTNARQSAEEYLAWRDGRTVGVRVKQEVVAD